MIALSYSRISDFRQCKKKFKLKYVDKAQNFYDESLKGPHLIRGGNVHKELQGYIEKKKSGKELQKSSLPEVESTKVLINNLMQLYDIYPELQVAVNDKFNRVDWYSKEAWFRVIFDVVGFGKELLVIDWKTGKFNDYSGSLEEPGQLHLSSLIAMAMWPGFEFVKNGYIFLDFKKTVMLDLNRGKHFDLLKEKLVEEHSTINAEEKFEENSGRFCYFCPANSAQCSGSSRKEKYGFNY